MIDSTAALVPVDELQTRLRALLAGRVLNFRLLRKGEGVVLRGLTHTYHAKQIAQHATMKACPLRILANEIEVA